MGIERTETASPQVKINHETTHFGARQSDTIMVKKWERKRGRKIYVLERWLCRDEDSEEQTDADGLPAIKGHADPGKSTIPTRATMTSEPRLLYNTNQGPHLGSRSYMLQLMSVACAAMKSHTDVQDLGHHLAVLVSEGCAALGPIQS